jgi:predicted RNA polymerase sigma factor
MRLGRVLATLVPAEGEAHGLVALMELQASRFRARVGPRGEAILLLDQDRGRWDRMLIGRGLAALDRAIALGGGGGFYALQAGIAACHARATTPEATDWARIASLYARLADVTRSPIVRLNHAVAVGRADGPAAGLALVDALAADPSLQAYPYLPSARGDLLERLGRVEEARAEFVRAATMTRNARDRDVLLARARR